MSEGPSDRSLDVEDARARILAHAAPLPTERLPLTTLALSPTTRTLASTTTSRRALPPFANSAMDGYGVRAADVAAPGTRLRVVATSLAGHAPDAAARPLGAGEAVAITTGAPIPPGVDAVVMREVCAVDGDVVVVNAGVAAGDHVRNAGEDVADGGVVGVAGDLLTPGRLNLLLAAGHVSVDVHRVPTVGILASGDELREIGEGAGESGTIINSNQWAIAMAAQRAGAAVRLLGIAKDTLDDHVQKMNVDDVDVLITIGGVSMGSHDFVRPALAQLGASLHLWKVNMRPGKPLAFGTLGPGQGGPGGQGGQGGRRRPVLVLGLPGNPVSALVTFALFGVPLLKKLMGQTQTDPSTTKAVLADAQPFQKKRGLAFFARAVVKDGRAQTVERQGSGQISGLAHANALVAFDKDASVVEVGSVVDVLSIP